MTRIYKSALWIAFAGVLWGLDSIIRVPTETKVSPQTIFFFEFLIGWIFIAPVAFIKERNNIFRLNGTQWARLAFLGIVGTTLGNVLFSTAVHNSGVALATAVQMTQPLFVAMGAAYFLREKKYTYFAPLAVLGVLNAVIMSVPSFSFGFSQLSPDADPTMGVLCSFTAMIFWGASTLFGKSLLNDLPPLVIVFWRWLFAAVTALVILKINAVPVDFAELLQAQVLLPVVLLGTVAGSVAMLIYYQGLRNIPASLATFVELVYPLTALVISMLTNPGQTSFLQAFAAVMVVSSIALMLKLEQDLESKKKGQVSN